jgi:hypothetical protein
VEGKVLKPQTTGQILRCLILGRYTAVVVVEGQLDVQGPQPLASSLPASIRAQRDELVDFLNEWAGGVWPPVPGSGLRDVEQLLGCGLGTALDVVEASRRRAAA